MLLSDGEIRLSLENGELTIDPPVPSGSLQPASMDLRLGSVIRVQRMETSGITLDPTQLDVNGYIENYTDAVNIWELFT